MLSALSKTEIVRGIENSMNDKKRNNNNKPLILTQERDFLYLITSLAHLSTTCSG